MGNPFGVKEIAKTLRLIVGAHDQFEADNRRGIWNAPASSMEHRNHRQHYRSRRNVEYVGSNDAHCVKNSRAMFIEHALWIPGRPACVAEATGVALIAFVPAVITVLCVQQGIEIVVEANVVLDR